MSCCVCRVREELCSDCDVFNSSKTSPGREISHAYQYGRGPAEVFSSSRPVLMRKLVGIRFSLYYFLTP